MNAIILNENDIAEIFISDGIATVNIIKDKDFDQQYLVYYGYTDLDIDEKEKCCNICGNKYYDYDSNTECPCGCEETSRSALCYTDIANAIYDYLEDGLTVTIILKNGLKYDFKLE